MHQGKTYALRLDVRNVSGEHLVQGGSYVIKIAKESLEKTIGPLRVERQGELIVGQKVEFRIPSGQLRRQSNCIVQLLSVDGKGQIKQFGRFEFLIMNYKNYSKSAFKIVDGDRTVGIINMTINISALQTNKSNEKAEHKPTKKPSKKQEKPKPKQEASILPPQSQKQITQPLINIKAPIEQIKLVCPSEAPREPKSMFSAFDGSGIVLLTKKEVNGERRKSDKKQLSSMGELFQKKPVRDIEQSMLKLPNNDNMARSCRLSPSRVGGKDSRYCKQIQQNLDNLSALDQESNRLSCSRSPLKQDDAAEPSIFDTLHRIKDKFQRIYQHQGVLNDDQQALDELAEVDEETEQKEKLMMTEHFPSNVTDLKKYNSGKEPQGQIQLGKSTIINLQVNSALSKLSDSDQDYHPSQCHITKTVDLLCPPSSSISPRLRITHCFNLQLQLNANFQLEETMKEIPTHKRYKLTMTNLVSPFDAEREEINNQMISSQLHQMINSQLHQTDGNGNQPPTSLTQSYLNFQIEQQSLKRMSYIKLNKISHLSRAADISKRRNNFLIKANEELKISLRLTEKKLEQAKQIIVEKEQIIDRQFKTLREDMGAINTKLSLKNEESLKREQKINSLQILLQQYARDINALKEDLRVKNATIRDLRCLFAVKEDSKASNKPEREELIISKSLREAVEQLIVSKNYNFGERKGERREERPKDLLAEIFQSEQRNNIASNFTSKTFVQDRKQRKYSSIDNTVNNINIDDNPDKSADLTSKTFRKFSHSKNNSVNPPVSHSRNKSNNTDLIFQKLTGLFSGDSTSRVLKNL